MITAIVILSLAIVFLSITVMILFRGFRNAIAIIQELKNENRFIHDVSERDEDDEEKKTCGSLREINTHMY